MEDSYGTSNGHTSSNGQAPITNGYAPTSNGHMVGRQSTYQPKASLPWLDVRVFYVRISKCEIDDLAPEFLTVNHIPLDPDTLLEVNGVRTSMYSDGATTILRRDRLDKMSEEATFVSTDSIRMTGSVKFEVFDKDVIVLSGVLELCNSNGFLAETHHGQRWSMNCETEIVASTSFFKPKQFTGAESALPSIEVYITGSFMGTPIILTKTLQFSPWKKHTRKGLLDSIPEYEPTEEQDYYSSRFAYQEPEEQKPEIGEYMNYPGTYLEGEDGELSWFNAGVRVGVGIGLSICVGVGIGVGLLVRTYQGTAQTFRRRLL